MLCELAVVEAPSLCTACRLVDLDDAMLDIDVEERIAGGTWRPPNQARLRAVHRFAGTPSDAPTRNKNTRAVAA